MRKRIMAAISGEAGLAPVYVFLVVGLLVIALVWSAGIYFAASSDGLSTTGIALVIFSPLLAGLLHAMLSAAALHRASITRSAPVRAIAWVVAGIYLLFQLAIFAGCVVLAFNPIV